MHLKRVHLTIFLFVAPFVVLLAVFQYWPIASMIHDSTFKFNFLNPNARRDLGLGNFRTAMSDQQVHQALKATILFAVGLVVLQLPLSFLLALFVNQSFPGVRFLRAAAFTPVVTSVVVVSTLWTFLLDPSRGLANSALHLVGIKHQPFLTSGRQALPSIIVMTVWEQIGLAMVLFVGGLQNIPRDLLEAAKIDGAGRWQSLRFVTLPLLKRTTLFVTVIMTVFALQAFTPAFVMTQGGPNNSTLLLVYFIYQNAFSLLRAGYASALSVILTVIILIVGFAQMYFLRQRRA